MLLSCVNQDIYQEEIDQLFLNRMDTKNSLEIDCEFTDDLKQYSQNQDELLKILAEQLGRIIIFLKVTSGAKFNNELFTNFFEEFKIYRSEKDPFTFISCKQDLRDNKIRAILGGDNLGGLEENNALTANKTEKWEQNVLKISLPNWMEDWSNNPDGVIFLVGDYSNNSLYLLQVAPALASEISTSKKIIYALYNHKKTIAEIAIVALVAYAYGSNAYGVKTMLTQKRDEILNFLKEFKEKIVNYAHKKGFKTNQQLADERTKIKKFTEGAGWLIKGAAKGVGWLGGKISDGIISVGKEIKEGFITGYSK
jgi:hypothetical protein